MASFSIAHPQTDSLRVHESVSRPVQPTRPHVHYWDNLVIAAVQMGAIVALAYASFVLKSMF